MNVALHTHGAERSDALRYVSLCTGGGGLDIGVGLAAPDARPCLLVEREAFACTKLVDAIFAGALDPAPLWSDARTLNGREWRGLVDGVIGGIPCQPHANIGKRQGEDDERDLWPDARRILVQTGAWFVLIENVEGILHTGGAARIWRDLSRLGFRMEGELFSATEVGGSHGRPRFFLLGISDQRFKRRAHMAHGLGARLEGYTRDGDLGREQRRDDPQPDRSATPGGFRVGEANGLGLFPPGPDDREGWHAVTQSGAPLEPVVCGMADGMADWMDRIRMLGNGVVPLQAAYAVRTLGSRLAAAGCAGAIRLLRGDQ